MNPDYSSSPQVARMHKYAQSRDKCRGIKIKEPADEEEATVLRVETAPVGKSGNFVAGTTKRIFLCFYS